MEDNLCDDNPEDGRQTLRTELPSSISTGHRKLNPGTVHLRGYLKPVCNFLGKAQAWIC